MAKEEKDFVYFFVKRLMDLVLSISFLIITSPIILIVSFLIWIEDRHNPFYSHIRIGKNRKSFKIYKFRSMVVNADEILFKDRRLYEQMRSGSNKVANDPRVTKIGKFIRKTSIDEFPQNINVIKGDMSFIGPRALRPDEFDLYEKKSPENKQKLDVLTSVKPGITGYWQVNGRSRIEFDKRMEMECYYAKNKSLFMDIVILLKTPIAVLKGEGAV